MRALIPWLIIALMISGGLNTWQHAKLKDKSDQIVILTDQISTLRDQASTVQAIDARTIAVTRDTYEGIVSDLKTKLDSVESANHIRRDDVIAATEVRYVYVNRGDVQATIDPVEDVPEFGQPYKLPVSYNSPCWSMKGVLVSRDPDAKLTITERTASNSIQLLVLKPRRFLGFLWRTRRQQFRVFSDCGEAKIAGVKFIDQ